MAKNITGTFRSVNAKISPLVRDRGLASTVGLLVSIGVQPALANTSAVTPVAFVPTTTHSHTVDTQTLIQHHHLHPGHNFTAPSTTNNTSGSTANNQTSTSTSGSSTPAHNHSNDTSGSASQPPITHSNSTSGSSSNSTGSSNPGSNGSSDSTSNHTSGSSNVSSSSSPSTGASHSQGHSQSHTAATPQTGNTTSTANIDLSSSAATYTLGTLGNFKTVTIDVGGQLEQVTATTKLTGAELLAADAALHATNASATQGLILNAQGVATGGDFTLNHATLHTLDAIVGGVGSLTIPTKVTFDDNLKNFVITGDLTNSGTINATTHSNTGNIIQANSIINNAGASISGTGALTLTATQTISNAGIVKSIGDLTLNANTVSNSPATAGGVAPTVSAGHDLIVNAPTINNSGTLHAANDVNFTNTSNIAINQSASANVSAGSNINFHDTSYTGSGNVTINGGNLLSQNLNIYAPTGQVDLSAGNVTGQLNGTIGEIHSNTQSNLLTLGNLNITGDPQFYNQGSIAIAGGVQDTNGAPLALIATGNITSAGGSLVTAGGDLTLIAGTNYKTNDGTTNSITAPNWSSVVTLTGASATGGYIDLTGAASGTAAIKAISTAATSAGNGGNVTMVAYYGSEAGSGTLATPAAVTINVNGIDYNQYNAITNPTPVLSTNGNVTFIANGYSNGVSMNVLSPIVANGATGGGGQILISNGTPTAVGTTIGGVASPYEIVNGQPYGSFTAGTLGGGTINFGAVTGYQPRFQSPEVGGNLSVSTNGVINATGALYDEGIQFQTNSNLLQTTNWTAGGISVNTLGYFAQNSNTTTTIDGVGGQYNITAGGSFINLSGTDNVHGGSLGPASLNLTETNSAAPIYVGYSSGLGHVSVDNAVFSGSTSIVVNGTLTTISSIDSPAGSGNLTFSSPGNLTFGGSGSIQNYGTFTANAAGYISFPAGSALSINKSANPNGWVFNAGSTLAINFSSLTTAPDPTTGNGGTISLTYGGNGLSYTTINSAPFTLSANANTTGTSQNGGTVAINITTNTAAPVIGNTPGEFIISANSGTLASSSGGQVSVTSINNMAIDPNYLSTTGTGTGGSVSFTSSAGNIYVRGSLSEAPTGGNPVNYGNITFTSPGNKSGFTVGGVTLEGVNGNLTGNVTIINPVGVSVSQGNSILGNQITITAPTINNSGTIKGTNIGQLVTSDVTLNTNNFNNLATGEIGAQVGAAGQSLISFSANTGNLTIAGTGKFDNTFGYSFNSSTGAVALGPLFTPAVSNADPTFDQITVNAKTTFAINADGLTTDGGASGKISISANQINWVDAATKPFTLNADGSNSLTNAQDGIYVTVTSTANNVIGTAAGQYVLQAENAGVGGTVSFTSGGYLIANETASTLNNTNGNLILSAATNLEIVGAIAQGSGAVTLTSTTPTGQFTVGTTPVPNGISGNISGGLITLNEPTVIVNNGSSISGTGIVLNTDVLLNNGTLTISGASTTGLVMTGIPISGSPFNLTFTNNGTITSPTEISVSNNGTVTIAGSGTYAPTTEYNFSGSTVNLGQLFATTTSNQFSQLDINATGLLTLATNDLQTQGLSTAPNAISINLGGGINYLNQNTTPLVLDTRSANGGGSVTYAVSNSTSPLTVGSAAGQLEIFTGPNTAGGNGVGNISLSSNGGVVVDPTWLVTSLPNNPGGASTNISLAATGTGAATGAVVVSSGNANTGWSNTLLGATGTLSISTNSANIFNIGGSSVPTNGIYTSNPITGGSISITANGGGINLGLANALQAQANGGSVSLTANGSITQLVGTTPITVQTISAPSITLTTTSTTGTVGSAAAPIIVGTPANATASTVSLTSATGVYVIDTSAGFSTPQMTGPNINTLTLSASAPTVSFTANNANAPLVLIPNGLVNSSTVIINAAGTTSSQGIETMENIGNQTGVVTLNAGAGTITEAPVYNTNTYPPIYIEGTTVALTANSVLSTNPVDSNFLITANALTYNGSMIAGQEILNNNYFPTTLNAGTTNNFNYRADGTVTITGVQSASGNYTVTSLGNLFVNAAINGAPGSIITLQTISGGAISSANGSVVSGPDVQLLSDYGNMTVGVNTAFLDATTTGVFNVANTYTGANQLFLSGVPTSVTYTSVGALTVDSGFSTSNGNISLESNTSIGLANGINLHASSTVAGLGAVYLSIGALPPSPQPGITPVGVTVNKTLGGLTYFGSSTNPNGSFTSNGANNVINASGRNVIINANGNSANITLAGNDTITADPPVGVSSIEPGAITPPAATNLFSATLNNSPVQASASNQVPAVAATINVVPTQISTLPSANLNTQGSSLLSQFNSSSLVHSDLSNGVTLSIPALPGSNNPVYSINPLSTASAGLVNSVSATSTVNSPSVVTAANTANTSNTAAAAAGVSAFISTNATIAEHTLSGGVSKKHSADRIADAASTVKQLDSGAMILCPEHDVTVSSPFGKVEVAAKSLVVLVGTTTGLSVFNLHDESRNSVMITADGKTTDVYPGRHVTISSAKEEKFEEINPGLFIPHRNMRVYETGSKKIYTSEFHIQSAIRGIEPLQALLSSSDREKQKMANKVYKTIAVLQVLTGKNGNFELLTPKPITAYNIESKAVYEGAAQH